MRSARLVALCLLCVLLTSIQLSGKSEGQERKRERGTAKVEVLPSEGVEVTYSRIETFRRQPNLEYKVINQTGDEASLMVIELMAFDENNELVGGTRVGLPGNVHSGTGTQGELAISHRFMTAARLTAKFIFLTSKDTNENPSLLLLPCSPNFCGPSGACGSMAAKCKRPPVSYHCEVGSVSCTCEFECG
ncbi:MAG: hypothetical protein JNK38_29050 [Acidobacteria bacterium]|nr:hypothetical protein [Acidobacteriota bacterium]